MTLNTRQLCRIELPAELQSLPFFLEKIIDCANRLGIGEHKVGAVELALEEAIVNIVQYSSSSTESMITVKCGLHNDNRFTIDIIDNGK